MTLKQLQYILEVFRQGNHISAAADALHTSQPGISKQIQLLEAELGFDIFLRKRNRINGLTEPGQQAIAAIKRVLNEIDNLKNLGQDFSEEATGQLTIGTTHTMARYVLPKIIEKFIKKYPGIRLGLRQGNPEQICELLDAGEVDISIGPDTVREFPTLAAIPCFPLARSVVAPAGHPVLKARTLTLKEIAKHPIITYDPAYSGRWKVMNAFRKAGIEPNIVFGAVDADVSKTYVELGLGIAILTTITYNKAQDRGLRARDASHLFESTTTYARLRANSHVRKFVVDFIHMLAPQLDEMAIQSALAGGKPR